jgi:hypothetical protein
MKKTWHTLAFTIELRGFWPLRFLTLHLELHEPLSHGRPKFMISINPDSYLGRRSIESKREDKLTWAIIVFCVLTPIAVLLFLQTGYFIHKFEHPGGEALLKGMADDRLEQARRREQFLTEQRSARPNATPLPKGLDYDPLLTAPQRSMLEDAYDLIKKNVDLEAEFQKKFHVSLKDLDAVVLPADKLSDVNCPRLGVEQQALDELKAKSSWSFSVGGFTVRDGTGFAKATSDGRPRMAINYWSFTTNKTLRRALLHEMFHAANIPAYSPFGLSIAHHDLTYLPEYSGLLGLAQLNDDCLDNIYSLSDDCLDNVIWFFLFVILGLLIRCLWLWMAYALKSRRRLRLNPATS